MSGSHDLLMWWLQSTALLSVAGLITHLSVPARVRRRLWRAAIGGSLLLATQSLWQQTLASLGWGQLAIQAQALSFEMPLEITASAPRDGIVGGSHWLVIAWASVAALLLARQLIAQVRVLRFVSHASPVSDSLALRMPAAVAQLVRVLPDERHGPFTAGLLRKYIYLPRDAEHWDDAQLRAVLTHEMAHVTNADCMVQLVADVHAALAWANPAAWWARAALAHERELIADEHVLEAGMRSEDYALVLLRLASRHSWLAAAAMAKPSTLATRIELMLQPRQLVSRWRVGLSAVLLAGAVVVAACANGPSRDVSSDVKTGEQRAFSDGAVAQTIDYRPAERGTPAGSSARLAENDLGGQPPAGVGPGSLDPALIKKVISDARAEFRDCFERALEDYPALSAAEVKLRFTIGVDGSPRDVSSNQIASAPALAPCMQRAVARQQFPRPAGGGEVIVNYPFRFARTDEKSDDEESGEDRTSPVESPVPGDGLSRAQVFEQISRARGAVNECFAGRGHGKVVLRFIISPEGKASNVELKQLWLDSGVDEKTGETAFACLSNAIQDLSFPRSPFTTPVTFPFLLSGD